MKIKNVATILICLFSLFFIAFSAVYLTGKKPVIAFYRVDDNTVEAIKTELDSLPSKNGKSFRYETVFLDENEPLYTQKKARKADLVFSRLDASTKKFAKGKKTVPVPVSFISGMPSSTRNSKNLLVDSSDENKLYAVPLLYDFFLIEVNTDFYNQTGIKKIASWSDFCNFLELTKPVVKSPFIFAGGDDDTLLDFFAGLTEALLESSQLVSVNLELQAGVLNRDLQNRAEQLLAEGGDLHPVITELYRLIDEGLSHSEVLEMTSKDVEMFMSENLCASSAELLSAHRKLPYETVRNYTSIYIPGENTDNMRYFIAPEIVGIARTKKDYAKTALNLLSSSRQANLSYVSGLAPANANCATPDIQADNARMWIAGSEGATLSYSEILDKKEYRHLFAETIRQYR